MALKVRTANGKSFRRCGIQFGEDWTVVDEQALCRPFGSPKPIKGKSPTVGEVLQSERALVCAQGKDAKPAKG